MRETWGRLMKWQLKRFWERWKFRHLFPEWAHVEGWGEGYAAGRLAHHDIWGEPVDRSGWHYKRRNRYAGKGILRWWRGWWFDYFYPGWAYKQGWQQGYNEGKNY